MTRAQSDLYYVTSAQKWLHNHTDVQSSQVENFVMIQLIPTRSSRNLKRNTSPNSFSVSASGRRSQDGLLEFIYGRGKEFISDPSQLRSENRFNWFLFSSFLPGGPGEFRWLHSRAYGSRYPKIEFLGQRGSREWCKSPIVDISARRANFLHYQKHRHYPWGNRSNSQHRHQKQATFAFAAIFGSFALLKEIATRPGP